MYGTGNKKMLNMLILDILKVDSVLFSRTISRKQAKTIIDKLRRISNKYFNAKVSYVSNLPELYHGDNKQVMYTLDLLNDAISIKKKSALCIIHTE